MLKRFLRITINKASAQLDSNTVLRVTIQNIFHLSKEAVRYFFCSEI